VILQQRESPSCLSLVIPCYNEEAVLPLLRVELTDSFRPSAACRGDSGGRWKFRSNFALSFELASANPAIKVIVLARNLDIKTRRRPD